MKFQFGNIYTVVCLDLVTNKYYRWHLDFLPWNKAYRIIDERLEIGTVFQEHYLILSITEDICNVCHGFDWDSYQDND